MSILDGLPGTAIKIGAGYLAVVMASNGTFGTGLQSVAQQFLGALNQTAGTVANAAGALPPPGSSTTTTSAGGGNNAAGVGIPAGAPNSGYSHQGGQTSGQLTGMISQNKNFVCQATNWRAYRSGCCGSQYLGDPNNWLAFRTYLTQIGAPDPGTNPPPEWPTFFGGTQPTIVAGC